LILGFFPPDFDVPTRVGVNRVPRRAVDKPIGCPHACGGEPEAKDL